MKSVAEGKVEAWLLQKLVEIKFTKQEVKEMVKVAQDLRQSFTIELDNKEKVMRLQIDNCNSKLSKLTDLLLEGTITNETYDQKREQFIIEKKTLESEIDYFKE